MCKNNDVYISNNYPTAEQYRDDNETDDNKDEDEED